MVYLLPKFLVISSCKILNLIGGQTYSVSLHAWQASSSGKTTGTLKQRNKKFFKERKIYYCFIFLNFSRQLICSSSHSGLACDWGIFNILFINSHNTISYQCKKDLNMVRVYWLNQLVYHWTLLKTKMQLLVFLVLEGVVELLFTLSGEDLQSFCDAGNQPHMAWDTLCLLAQVNTSQNYSDVEVRVYCNIPLSMQGRFLVK